MFLRSIPLSIEQEFLALESPPVASERTIRTNHPMAGHHDRCGVGGAGPSHSTHRAWLADFARDFSIAARRAAWNGSQRFPHAALERGCHHVGRQVEPRLRAGELANNRAYPVRSLARAAPNFGLRIFPAKLRHKPRVIFSDRNGGDSAGCRGDKNSSQRTIGKCVRNLHPSPAPPVGGRCHAKIFIRSFVDPARCSIACFVQCGGHVDSFSQIGFETRHAERVGVLPRRDSHGFPECPLQMMRTHLRSRGEALEIRARICIRRDLAAHLADQFRLRATAFPLRMASAAWAKSGLFRCFGHGEQDHLPGSRPARWAGWTAINSR